MSDAVNGGAGWGVRSDSRQEVLVAENIVIKRNVFRQNAFKLLPIDGVRKKNWEEAYSINNVNHVFVHK